MYKKYRKTDDPFVLLLDEKCKYCKQEPMKIASCGCCMVYPHCQCPESSRGRGPNCLR